MCEIKSENPVEEIPQEYSQAAIKGRLCKRGKFFFRDEKFFIRGVTYGTFHPDENGVQYPSQKRVARDFAMMESHSINAIRTYTVPPSWLLDLAAQHNLDVMVGLPWEQHITFLDDRRCRHNIIEQVRRGVTACAGHPAVFCYVVGNEIPASIVRWYGAKRIERFIKLLYKVAKSQDPNALFTYVNYPTTEYLRLPFLDFCCFNVYLETQQSLETYLAHLQIIAGDKPLLMAEVGLDSRRNGEKTQAQILDWQIRTTFAAGCAGIFMFSWTDEWYRGGYDIEDWDFGLTTRDRTPKASLAAVENAFADVPFSRKEDLPRISVVLCSYNGSATIKETLDHLQKLDYPNYEIIVVNDGSTDTTETIASQYDVRLISVDNGGLSRARNIGLKAATGEIVAYIDDDAYPDPHWLSYLAYSFKTTNHAAVGGPNIQPAGNGHIAECVANAPGGPIHVLISDRQAEHIPGCNMAFRKTHLDAIGGFDPQFRVAGDDVDVCWRILEKGWTIGFHPAAMVWHHRRNSIRTYWRQQVGYGKAETLLEKKWPEKYNPLGHATWSGQIYDNRSGKILRLRRSKIYHGIWGTALFQKLYQPWHGLFTRLHELPEWYLFILFLGILSALGLVWYPLIFCLPFFIATISVPVVQAIACTRDVHYASEPKSSYIRTKLRTITILLFLMQPLARLWGRLKHGLTPWRKLGQSFPSLVKKYKFSLWAESWSAPEKWLKSLEAAIRSQSMVVRRGGDFDVWDLDITGGIFCSLRVLMAIEEHGGGKQLARFKGLPRFSMFGLILILACASLCAWAFIDKQWIIGSFLGACALIFSVWILCEWAYAGKSLQSAVQDLKERLNRIE
ncbi:MAG: glycosyltransferase [Sedimentisphaerales bacterium]|nr:glycosyltransferase [Sedimentisphaerales bacterium]